MLQLDWGSVPAWLAGLAALVAVVYARAAARSARETSASQQTQIEDIRREGALRREEQRREQAAGVTIWVTTLKEEKQEGRDQSLADLRVGVCMSNSSELPIYQLLFVGHVRGKHFVDRYTTIGPRTLRRVLGRLSRDVNAALEEEDHVQLLVDDNIRVSCSFRDSSGIWWYRRVDGALDEAVDQIAAESRAMLGPLE